LKGKEALPTVLRIGNTDFSFLAMKAKNLVISM
jgi:hypothetical protein